MEKEGNLYILGGTKVLLHGVLVELKGDVTILADLTNSTVRELLEAKKAGEEGSFLFETDKGPMTAYIKDITLSN